VVRMVNGMVEEKVKEQDEGGGGDWNSIRIRASPSSNPQLHPHREGTREWQNRHVIEPHVMPFPAIGHPSDPRYMDRTE